MVSETREPAYLTPEPLIRQPERFILHVETELKASSYSVRVSL